MGIAKLALDGVWNHIATVCHGVELNTPADKSTFVVTEVRPDGIAITFKSKESIMNIGKAAFEGALRYLLEHGHHAGAPCEIRSSSSYVDAGPLCRASRTEKEPRNSTYVLPILKEMGLVGIEPRNSAGVSTAWYIA